jgi:hypothetical protein
VCYGPLSYLQPIIVGFIAGSVIFLIGDLARTEANVVEELPLVLISAGAGAAGLLLFALAANFVIGKRVLDELELQEAVFGGGVLPPPRPRPDVPGIDIMKASPSLRREDIGTDQAA